MRVIRLIVTLTGVAPPEVEAAASTLRQAGMSVGSVNAMFGIVAGTAPTDIADALRALPFVGDIAREDHLWDLAAFRR